MPGILVPYGQTRLIFLADWLALVSTTGSPTGDESIIMDRIMKRIDGMENAVIENSETRNFKRQGGFV